MEFKANCKINLGLRILRRRDDDFHDIETVMVPVCGLYDELTVEKNGDNFLPESDLCMRAMRLMQAEFGIGEAHIRLRKNIPVGAGLGGGSADAAAMLKALNKIFELDLTVSELKKLGAKLGSDVPFFIRNTPQLCTGRGEIMTPVDVDLKGLWIAILKPEVSVSTAEAYAGVVPNPISPNIPEILCRPVSEWRDVLANDFEASVFALHPKIAELKNDLYASGALYASMSGSGSAVFGIFDHKPNLEKNAYFCCLDRFGTDFAQSSFQNQ